MKPQDIIYPPTLSVHACLIAVKLKHSYRKVQASRVYCINKLTETEEREVEWCDYLLWMFLVVNAVCLPCFLSLPSGTILVCLNSGGMIGAVLSQKRLRDETEVAAVLQWWCES